MRQTRQANEMQERIATREDARDDLHELRDRALVASAGQFLLDEVEEEFESTQMPRVFERARNHFSAFTHHKHELKLDSGHSAPQLVAQDLVADRRRELEELSDGTRAQLLLAARIAFAEEVENGMVLPLFLDEALDQSDPDRFAAIVESLGRVAAGQGRQIIYLTADPLDLERIRGALGGEDGLLAPPIDLGQVRTREASPRGPESLKIGSRKVVPAPEGMSVEEYGARLGVPAFRPRLGWTEQHVFYLFWDDLDLLHDFLRASIERAGQWKTVAGTPLAERLGSRSIPPSEIDMRLNLLEVHCELWNQGRGRPVDADALKDSGALTDVFLGKAIAIANELDGDAERLLAAFRRGEDSRLKRFRNKNLERLRSFLVEHEFLDDRPVFTESELRLKALSSPAANELSGRVARDCLHRWWQWAEASIETGSEPEAK